MEDASQYEEIHPEFTWKNDVHANVLELVLPDFKKEQLKVQIDNRGNLRISGERPTEGVKWARFKKEFPIPPNAKTNEIKAKFEKPKLYVSVPIRVDIPKIRQPPQEENEVGSREKIEDEGLHDKKKMGQRESQEEEEFKEEESNGHHKDNDDKKVATVGALTAATVGLIRPHKFALKAVVAALVVMAFGIYLAYKFWPKQGVIDQSETKLHV